jgi:hypothetical protein
MKRLIRTMAIISIFELSLMTDTTDILLSITALHSSVTPYCFPELYFEKDYVLA